MEVFLVGLVKMDELELHNEIRKHVKNGGNITHILNVKILNQIDEIIENNIKQEIFRNLNGIPITKIINNINITITWHTNTNSIPSYYYADVLMFGDVAVQQHSKILLRDLLNIMDAQFDNIFSDGTVKVEFLVTKPLSRTVVLV
jgi:hypothetical protein